MVSFSASTLKNREVNKHVFSPGEEAIDNARTQPPRFLAQLSACHITVMLQPVSSCYNNFVLARFVLGTSLLIEAQEKLQPSI